MTEGGLDAVFMIVYVGQPSLQTTPDAFDRPGTERPTRPPSPSSTRFAASPRDRTGPYQLALSAADVRRINASGRKVALIGVENGYPIGTDLRRVKEFYDRGARYLSLAHNGHSQLSDSNTGETEGWKWHGLSPLGKQVIAELNRVGIMIDVSHPVESLDDAGHRAVQSADHRLALVGAGALQSQPQPRRRAAAGAQEERRRRPDRGLRATTSRRTDPPERAAALAALRKEFGLPANTPLAGPVAGADGAAAPRAAAPEAPLECPSAAPSSTNGSKTSTPGCPRCPRATVKDFVDHIDYIVKKIGIDHVGISSDFDGGGGIDGWNDASETFNVTLELVRRGYSEAQIGKIWSGNLLRVMEQVAKIAARPAKAGGR